MADIIGHRHKNKKTEQLPRGIMAPADQRCTRDTWYPMNVLFRKRYTEKIHIGYRASHIALCIPLICWSHKTASWKLCRM